MLFSENAFRLYSYSSCKLRCHSIEIYFHVNMRNWSDTLKVSKKDEVKVKACSIIELSYAEKEKMKV